MVRFGEAVAWLFFLVGLVFTLPFVIVEALKEKKES